MTTLIEALEALRPFAEYAEQMQHHESWKKSDSAFYGVKREGAKQITYGDFRRAMRVVADAKERDKSHAILDRLFIVQTIIAWLPDDKEEGLQCLDAARRMVMRFKR